MARGYLKKIYEGTTIYLLGIISSRLINLISTIIIVRYLLSPREWGILSLSLYIITLVTTIGGAGLPSGTTRFISFYKAQGDDQKVHQTILCTLKITSILGLVFSSVLLLFSEEIATSFNKPKLTSALKILAITILIHNMINILVAIFRGYRDVKVQAIFQSIFPEAIKIILFLFAIILGLGFYGIISIYSIYPLLALVLLIIYSITKLREGGHLVGHYSNHECYKTGIELLKFSIPLLLVLSMWLDLDVLGPIMLGYLVKEEEIVGIYRATWILSKHIPWILTSIIFIYLPVVTELYSKKRNYEIQEIYSILTKWAFMISFSIFILLFLYSEIILDLFFGKAYISGATALRILAFGYI
ncbi:MAG: oligosaccharide flippase family protein, partial [Nitrospinae bacterium]|nr:oligosaccharide flippase family protein [Nitrospinota bacterium]